ncbi:MAG: GAF domain-containing sensor histidine kinase [Chloroflexi bacterium]|nr:GAF domain-containing sensor histidine kinase [Chloroflexota bacterium]
MPRSRSPSPDALERRNRELRILNAIAETLNREVDVASALSQALARVLELFDLRTGWVWLFRAENGQPYLAAAQNLPPALANHPETMEGFCHCLSTFIEGDLAGAANVNVIECSRLQKLVDGTDGLRFHSSIPLYAHGRKLGVFNVASPEWREISPDDLRLLHTIGDFVAIAIERAHLYAQSADHGAAQERNRLAREIHDTLAQGLTAITLQLETAEALLEAGLNPDTVREKVHAALALARQNLDEARRSVLDLRAAPLEGRSLPEALQALVDSHAGIARPEIRLDLIGAGRPLPIRLQAGLYRIAQEALTNAVRHARAARVDVRLELLPGEARLTVQDDGQGFDSPSASEGRYGLVGLNERVHLLGGRLRLETEPGAGTLIEVAIPLEPHE